MSSVYIYCSENEMFPNKIRKDFKNEFFEIPYGFTFSVNRNKNEVFLNN